MGPLRPHQASDRVAGYLARGEDVVLEMKQHWARVLPAITSCVVGFVLVIVAGICAPAWMGPLTNAAWWIWLVLAAHLAWRVVEWWDQTFVITNKRLILVHGLFVKKVAMMPLSKVTDMSYNRSPAARLLGYGTFKIESAGQEQALNVIDFVRNPDEKYRDICGLIFGFEDEDDPRPSGHADARHADDEGYDDEWRDPWVEDDWRDESQHDESWDGDGWSDDEQRRETPRRESQRRESQRHGPSGGDDTRPLAVRQPRARYGRGQRRVAEDDTDPHGFVTVDHPNPHSDTDHTYRQRHDRDETSPEQGDESAWWVSREHATSPQPVRRRGRDHDVDDGSTWRDGT